MKLVDGVVFDEKGSIIEVGDEIVITKILTDLDMLEYIKTEGEIWRVKEIDKKDSDIPLYLTKKINDGWVTEWLGVEDAEVVLFNSIKSELDEQMEQVGNTEITSKGLQVKDGLGNITVHINSDGEFMGEKERIQRIVKRQISVYIAKNDDYGDSVLKGRKAFGAMSELTRMSDKINRFNALVGKEDTAKVAESLDDTVMDLVNYMAMYYSDLEAVNSIAQIADNLVNILSNPESYLKRLADDMCMGHCLDKSSMEFHELVDKVKYLR